MKQDDIFSSDLESILQEFSSGGGKTDRMPEQISAPLATSERKTEQRLPPESDKDPFKNEGLSGQPAENIGEPKQERPEQNVAGDDKSQKVQDTVTQGNYYTEMPIIPLTEEEYTAMSEGKLRSTAKTDNSVSRADSRRSAQEEYVSEYEEGDVIPEAEGKRGKNKKAVNDYDEDKPKNKWIVPLAIVLVLIVGGLFGMRYAAKTVDAMDTIFPNVYLNGIPLGKLTAEEAAQTLESCNWEKVVSGSLEVRLPMNVNAYVDYVQAGVRMSQKEAIEVAMAYGREDNIYSQLFSYVNSMVLTNDIVDRAITINSDYVNQQLEEGIKEFNKVTSENAYEMDIDNDVFIMLKGAGEIEIDQQVLYTKVENALRAEEESVTYRIEGDYDLAEPDFDAILKEVEAEAQDAYYDPEKDEIVEEVVGLVFDPKTASKIWEAAEPLATIEVPLDTTKAEVTKEDLEAILFRDVLGEYTTSFKGSSSNRCSNINLAVNTVNGIVLMPGETFSYNKTLGERTEEKGYLEAAAYDNGEVIQAIGGGICQVSSTLCCAVRLSLLDYTRTNHQFQVAYIDAGLDATVDYTNFENGGGVDFTFTNNKDQPIKIVGSCDNDTLEVSFQILGTDYDHYKVEFKNKFICYLTHAEAFPGDTDHSDEYNATRVGYIYDAYLEVYDQDGNFVKEIYTYDYDRCWYFYHTEDRGYPYEPDDSVPDETVEESVPT